MSTASVEVVAEQGGRYTADHHREDPKRYPIHGACGLVWLQRGEKSGHCSQCHRVFEGLKAFDAHQKIQADGSVKCVHPLEAGWKGYSLRLVDGSWRGPGMDRETIEARFGAPTAL